MRDKFEFGCKKNINTNDSFARGDSKWVTGEETALLLGEN